MTSDLSSDSSAYRECGLDLNPTKSLPYPPPSLRALDLAHTVDDLLSTLAEWLELAEHGAMVDARHPEGAAYVGLADLIRGVSEDIKQSSEARLEGLSRSQTQSHASGSV